MGRKRQSDGIRVLMALSMIGLMAFFAFWLIQSYQHEKKQLQRDASFLLMSSVREVEDSLMQSNSWEVGELVNTISVAPEDTVNWSVRLMVASDSLLSSKPEALVRSDLRYNHPRHLKTEKTEKHKFPGMIGYLVYNNAVTEGQLSTSIPDQISILLNHKFTELKNELNLLPNGQIVIDSSLLNVENQIQSTRIYQDLMTNAKATVVVKSYRGYIIKELIPHFIIAFVILLLTLFSFILLHRTAMKQSELADARKALLANITHELNTPITSASLALESIQTRPMSDGEKSEYVVLASEELQRLSSLVNKIMAGMASGNNQLNNLAGVNMTQLVEGVLDSMKLKINQMNGVVNLRNEIGNPALIQADRLVIISVIQNLVDNALKYSQPNPQVQIVISQTEDEFSFVISDNGVGIPTRLHTQVFEPFYRVPTGDVHDVKGHGLGLNYAKQVIEAHGGRISIMKRNDAGTTCQFTLPCK